MRQGSIADLINSFYGRVGGSVIANGKIGTGQIIIDCSGNANRRNVEFLAEYMKSAECAVASDGNQTINSIFLQILKCFFPSFFCPEDFASRCFKNSSSALKNIAHGAGSKFYNVTVDHAFITTHDSVDFFVVINGGTYNGAQCGVH